MSRFFGAMRTYDNNKTLSRNFASMCGFCCFKPDSAATVKLKNIIQQCHFTENDVVEGRNYETRLEKRRQQLAKLETVKLAILEWHQVRDKFSSRVDLVNQFERKITAHQKAITFDDLFDYTVQVRKAVVWKDPDWDEELKYENYLPQALKVIFNALREVLAIPNDVARRTKGDRELILSF